MKTAGGVYILKFLLGVYILMCLTAAGLNYGVAPKADRETAALIANFWHFYENEFKTILILVCSALSISLTGRSGNRMRRRNYSGFIISALVVHITGPLITGTKELYFFSMPLPWSSLSIQVFDKTTEFSSSFTANWGTSGLGFLLFFVIAYNLFVFGGTLLFGRRLQCSQICLFNGFASEIFSEAFPLSGVKKRKAGKSLKIIFTVMRYLLLAAALLFTILAILSVSGIYKPANRELLYTIETSKYLSIELLMAMFFWVFFTGRGYCYYCPAGTVLGFLSRAAGQKIQTDKASCVECGSCNSACPMSLDVRKSAVNGEDLASIDCVGCCHCVDVCPTGTLAYTTDFLTLIHKK